MDDSERRALRVVGSLVTLPAARVVEAVFGAPLASCPLPQPREHLEARVPVGRFEALFALEAADREHRLTTNPAIRAIGIKAGSGEAELDFLYLSQGRGTLAARKLLNEWPVAVMSTMVAGARFDRELKCQC